MLLLLRAIISGSLLYSLVNHHAVDASSTWLGLLIRFSPKGGCQNYGPFLGPYNNAAPNI